MAVGAEKLTIDNSFLVDIRYVNGKPQCSGVDPTPSSPGEGLAPWDAMDTNVQRVALRPGGGRLPPLHPVRKRYTQCSGDDPSPASPAEGLAPVGCYEYECSTSGLTARWRQVAAATPGTFNRIRNTVCNQNDKTMRKHCRKCPQMLGKRGKKRNGNKEKVRA